MQYLLKPIDVLSFRDGRPFGSSDEHKVSLLFPPNLTSFYGALRAAVMAECRGAFINENNMTEEIKKISGSSKQFGSLKINDFGFFTENKKSGRIFITPSDFLKVKGSKPERYIKLHPDSSEKLSNLPEGLTMLSPESEKDSFYESAELFITKEGFIKYLTGEKITHNDFLDAGEFFSPENRTGIKINRKNRTVEEGALFSIEFARLKDESAFIIETDYSLKLNLIKLGGEGRACSVQPLSEENDLVLPDVKIKNGIKVIMLTPLLSSQGWCPEPKSIETLEKITGLKLKLTSAAIGKYKGVGGWNIVENMAKPQSRYIQEGSVFFFESEQKNIEIKINKPINICADPEDFKQGFGLAAIGGY